MDNFEHFVKLYEVKALISVEKNDDENRKNLQSEAKFYLRLPEVTASQVIQFFDLSEMTTATLKGKCFTSFPLTNT